MNDEILQWLESPVGAVASSLLQDFAPDETCSYMWKPQSATRSTVEETLSKMAGLTFDDIALVLQKAEKLLSPYDPTAPSLLAECRLDVEGRRPLLEDLVRRWGPQLREFGSRQWTFRSDDGRMWLGNSLFGTTEGFQVVFQDGSFPWGGVWSFSPLGDVSSDLSEQVWEWEHDEGLPPPVEVAPTADARIARIVDPRDWVELIQENPGSQTRSGLAPDWTSVARQYDAVNLTWWGSALTKENLHVTDRQGVISLYGWWGGHTLWLNPEALVVVSEPPTPT